MQRRRTYATYGAKSQFGGFSFNMFRKLIIYIEFFQVSKALTVKEAHA